MESGSYEISFPDSDQCQGLDMDYEIRPKDPEVKIYAVRRVSRRKEYRQMTRLEKEVLILNLLNQGSYARDEEFADDYEESTIKIVEEICIKWLQK